MEQRPLADRIALVAGGTRGAGRAIAVTLAESGAYVILTGRSSRANRQNSRPETIEETVDIIHSNGGEGRSIRLDHNDEAGVLDLFKGIEGEFGHLDICINDIWGGEAFISWDRPFWEQDTDTGIRMFSNAVFTHVKTAKHAIPLLMKSKHGLLVEVTDGVGYHYRGDLFYSLVKIATNHLSLAYQEEFKNREIENITSVSITPGFLRSEEMLDLFGVRESNWRDAIKDHPDFAGSESPYYLGRALAYLAADPQNSKFNGQTLSTWGLHKEYHFQDTDGTSPDWQRFHDLYHSGQIDPETWRY